jgi:hypothetical protein
MTPLFQETFPAAGSFIPVPAFPLARQSFRSHGKPTGPHWLKIFSPAAKILTWGVALTYSKNSRGGIMRARHTITTVHSAEAISRDRTDSSTP